MKNNLVAPINRIIHFSNVDGPGNRLVIFFQSCPFSCLFCHNPETIRMCNHCGECVKVCSRKALYFVDNKVMWDEKKCINCDNCIHRCKNLSSPKITYMDVPSVLEEIKNVRPFIRGITVSGGECMNHAPFLKELFSLLRKKDPSLSILIDSNGAIDFEKHPDLLSMSNGVMLDVKAFDPLFHREVTGVSNEMVLKNLHFLLRENKLEEVRTVIFPYFQKENECTVKNVARIIKSNVRYKLLKYRYFGVREEGIRMFGKLICSESELLHYESIARENGCFSTVII